MYKNKLQMTFLILILSMKQIKRIFQINHNKVRTKQFFQGKKKIYLKILKFIYNNFVYYSENKLKIHLNKTLNQSKKKKFYLFSMTKKQQKFGYFHEYNFYKK